MRKMKVIFLLVLFLGGIFVTMSATQPVSAERKSAVYYYDHLTDADRLKVRKAMDMAIPRESIINNLLQGLGLAIASPIEANVIGYDPTITPRDYDLEAGLDLMEEVFDYRYNDSADTAEDREGYFPMVLMTHTGTHGSSRDDRMQWAALVTKSFQEIGIDTTIKYVNWNIVTPRVFSPAEGEAGFDYEHGGQDAFFIGWSGYYRTDVSKWFGTDQYPPAGLNIEYCASQEVKDIINASLQDPVLANRLAKIKEFQQWFYDDVPYFIILQEYEIWAKDPELKGVDTGFTYPNYRNWTQSTQTAINVHSLGEYFNLDPMISFGGWLYTKEWYDSLITNYPDDPSVYYGNLAYDNWTTSVDGLVWDFWIREGIKFSDGNEMTIDDVVFSLKRFLNPTICVDPVIPFSGEFVNQYINSSSIEIVSGNQFRVTLNSFHAYASDFFTFPILSEAEMSLVDDLGWGNWALDANTGIVPTGTGSFMMDEEATDLANGTCVMVQNPYYDGSLRDAHGQYVNDNMLEKITVKVGTTAAAAVADLSNGVIDIIDSRAGLPPFLAQLNSTDNVDWSEVILALEWGHQALYINQFSPYWGMNPADPRIIYPGDYDGVPFDLAAIFFGILCLATFQIVRKRKR